MLKISNLATQKELGSAEMEKIIGGWFFGWGGVIGNPRRQPSPEGPTSTYISGGRRVRDYRNPPTHQWPDVD
jgi:hypothetical protein